MKSMTWDCKTCKRSVETQLPQAGLICPHCHSKGGDIPEETAFLRSCWVCGCRQFYTQKDFNRGLGCLIVLIGILLVPKTYGLSLPVFAFFDWLIYRQMRTLIVCYRCGAEFRGFDVPGHLKPFMHHIGMKYDKYR